MSIDLVGYSFEGPFTKISELKDESGVYAILDKNGSNYSPIDFDLTKKLPQRFFKMMCKNYVIERD